MFDQEAIQAGAGLSAVAGSQTPADLLEHLGRLGIEVWAEGERLRYRAPKGQISDEIKNELVRRKTDLLAWFKERGAPAAETLPRIVPAPEARYEPFPLTDLQQAYWIGRTGAFELGNVAPHFYLEADLPGLDLEQFNRALVALIERHDMLRAIVGPDGRQQILREVPPYRIARLDLRGLPEPEVTAGVEAVRREMSHQVLAADRWPLFEIRATEFDGGLVRLHMSFDLLIGDVWSFQIFFRELFQLYRDPAAALPDLELSFRDYVLAEAAFQKSERYRRSQEYWWQRLPTLPPAPELPVAVDPASLERPHFVRHSGRLEPELWSRLKARAARAGLTSSGTLLAAFSEVLAVWSKTPRFTLNLTFFNRLPFHPQINDIMGDFSATLLLAIEGLGTTFEERAQAIQQQLWRDLEHVHVSGVRVLRELARVRRAWSAAAMPVVFTSALHTSQSGAEETATEESWQTVYGISQTPQVWLDHRVTEQGGALTFSWDVVEELFPAGLMEAMFGAYCGLLERLAAGEEAWRAVEPGLVPAGHLAVCEALNATAAPVPEGLLHGGFLEWAGRAPERPAVIAAQHTVTYGELLRRSRELAHRLRQLGAEPNRLVAVVMEKGWEQVVAALGILESGAAYLPVDAGLPRERIWHLLARGEVSIALTQPWLLERLAWPEGVERLAVAPEAPAGEVAPLPPRQRPEDLAYVIFTSGSTGEPKGVMIDHRGALNTIVDVNRRFAVGPEDRVLGLAALSFDLSVYDLFGPLAAGGAVVLPEPWAAREPGRWAEWLAGSGVTVWNSVPALMEMLVEHLEARAEGPGALRLVMLSGDWIPVSLPDRIRKLWPGVSVVSLGGATEASIWSILYPIGQVEADWKSIPYGRPMVNQTFQVLDERLEPRPAWVPGDLYIGGVGLALGYWRDEEKTAASFVVHPRTGERLYRTGDLGYHRPDGTIVFLGREDSQVKIGGHRIELGEIEATLERLPEVRAAAVAVAGHSTNRRLVAYVVLDAPEPAAPRGPSQGPVRGLSDEELAKLEFKLREPGLRREDDLPALRLPRPGPEDRFLAPFEERRSYREFRSTSVAREDLERVLGALAGEDARRRSLAASGRSAVEVSVWIKRDRVAGLPGGTYRYLPAENRLEPLRPGAEIAPHSYAEINRTIFEQAAFAVFLTGRVSALQAAYGERARESSLLESGAIGQLLMEAAPASGIGLCPIGTVSSGEILPLVAPDAETVLLHSLLGGGLPAGSPGGRREEERGGAPEGEEPFRNAPLSREALGAFLSSVQQVRLPHDALPKYRYPSAGNLYPVQLYVAVRPERVEGVEAGLYYHDPKGHRLVLLSPWAEIPAGDPREHRLLDQGAFSLFLVSRPSAIQPIYGDLADDFCLLEAGYMSQLLRSAGSEDGVGFRPLDSVDFSAVRGLFRLEPDQALLWSAAAGPAASAARARTAVEEPARTAGGKADEGAAGERLRARLAETLPEYMVPDRIVLLDKLPLTANGKVDRGALADWQAADAPAPKQYVAPAGEMERALVGIWEQILGAQGIGVYDNFFDLGGSSVQAVQLQNRIREDLGRDVRIIEIFKHSTVSALAKALSGTGEGERQAGQATLLQEAAGKAQREKEALRRQKELARRRARE